MAHNLSVKAGCAGRGGRLPAMTANMAVTAVLLLNGTVPVNT